MIITVHGTYQTTYLLESLGSCSPNPKFIMYFTINSAFSHFMSLFGLSENETISTELIENEHVFDIFLNNSFPPLLLDNSSLSLAPLNPPTSLLKLFQTMNLRSQTSPYLPFFPLVRHTSDQKPTKGSFLFFTPGHISYMSTSFIITCMIIPQVYLACKHKKLHTLVAGMTLRRLPGTEALSAFEIPNTKEVKLICQDPWSIHGHNHCYLDRYCCIPVQNMQQNDLFQRILIWQCVHCISVY